MANTLKILKNEVNNVLMMELPFSSCDALSLRLPLHRHLQRHSQLHHNLFMLICRRQGAVDP